MTDAELDALIDYARKMPEGWSLHKYADAIAVLREQVAALQAALAATKSADAGSWLTVEQVYETRQDCPTVRLDAAQLEADNAALRKEVYDLRVLISPGAEQAMRDLKADNAALRIELDTLRRGHRRGPFSEGEVK